MLQAPSLREVKEHIKKAGNPICCILFAPNFDKIGANEIIPRLGYLDYRTGEKIHFYCVGYMGYAHKSDYPDLKDLGEFKYKDRTVIPWSFSQRKFAEFVDELEKETSWKYSGGTELILLNSKADFSNAIIFKIDSMLRDGAIYNVNDLFEALIQQSREEDETIEKFSLGNIGKVSGQFVVKSIFDLLPSGLKSFPDIWIKGKHYSLLDIS